ncbi:MAG TPA: hypothetical protein VE130_06595 [Nitrososphaeraceae archaeon]|nr:hypothetical protein [Nitrososphaeraceae archaeon]
MKQPSYVCVTCSQSFTRKSSGKRHNLNIHSGMGCIVRFLDYIVGRVKGQYAAADPLSFRKNKGNNFRNLRPIKSDSLHLSSKNSDADSIAAADVHDLSSNNRPFIQERNTDHDPSSTLALARIVLELCATKSSTASKSHGIILPDGTYAIQIHSFLTQQFSNKYIFGYVGYVCPLCAYYTIDQLEFRGGSTWSIYHKCITEANTTGEKRESVSSRYFKACDDRPYYLNLFTRAWLNNNFHIFAIKLPFLDYMDRELIEIPDPVEPSKSICICVSKEEIIELGDNREYWAGRAIANERKPIPISEREMMDFLSKTDNSTFGIFKIRLTNPPGWKSEYFVIYLGK